MIGKLIRVFLALAGLSLLCVVPAVVAPSHPFFTALGFLAAYVTVCWVALYIKDAMRRYRMRR